MSGEPEEKKTLELDAKVCRVPGSAGDPFCNGKACIPGFYLQKYQKLEQGEHVDFRDIKKHRNDIENFTRTLKVTI